jgi:hypothetical protein
MAKIPRPPTPAEYNYVHHVEKHWYEHKRFPMIGLSSKIIGLPVEEVQELLKSEVVLVMLDNRGIRPDTSDPTELSEEQLAAANIYLNISDTRPLSQKLEELGISRIRFNGWMKGKAFSKYLTERAEELFEEGMPFAHRELLTKVMHGNLNAIRLFYEVSGRYTGVQSVEQQSIGLLIQRLLEAIQMEVSDPETIKRIGQRFQTLAANEASQVFTPQPQPVLALDPSDTPREPADRASKVFTDDGEPLVPMFKASPIADALKRSMF